MSRRSGRRRNFVRGLVLSVQLLAAHRVRTLLSVSGLLVGVATVMVMVAIGRGAEQRVLDRLQSMGTDLLVVSAAPARAIVGRPQQSVMHTLLRESDVEAIREASPSANAAAPVVTARTVVRWDGRNTTTLVTGTTRAGLGLWNIAAARGRLFDEGDDELRERVAVVGPTTARSLFGATEPIGQVIRIGNVPVEVIGVARARGVDPGGTDLDDVLLVPLGTVTRRILNVPFIHTVLVQARSSSELPMLETEVRGALRRLYPDRTGVAEPFVVRNQALLLRTEQGAAQAMNRLVVSVGGLALFVGGVGILVVMMMSVRERTREIGLRRALGATQRDIAVQFLVESVLIAVAGGGIGVAIGLVTTVVAGVFGPWDLIVSWPAAAAGVLSSTLLGLTVGAVPATRASRLEPIDALRSR